MSHKEYLRGLDDACTRLESLLFQMTPADMVQLPSGPRGSVAEAKAGNVLAGVRRELLRRGMEAGAIIEPAPELAGVVARRRFAAALGHQSPTGAHR